MATTNDLKNGMTLNIDGQLWSIVEFQHVKPGKGGAFVRTKLKNVMSGKVVDRTFNAGVKVPDAVSALGGSIDALFSGAQTGASDDPYNGINEVVGPGTWTLGPHAFGNSSITEASNADLRVAIIGGREIVSVWQSGLSALMQVGTDPSTQPQSIQPNGQLVTAPAVAVDQASNIAVE